MLDTNILIPRPKGGEGLGTVLAKNRGVVFSIIRFFPSSRQRPEVVELLRSVQDLTRPIPGCVGCWLSEDDFLYSHVRYAEQWESEEALHEHIRSDLYGRVLSAMELSKQAPEVRFYFSSQNEGMELIERLRYKHKLPLGPPTAVSSNLE